jgi:hypothetical protein
MFAGAEIWAGPAIIAALVTALLTLWRDWQQERRGDRQTQRDQQERRRRQKDTAAALMAEIDAFRRSFSHADLKAHMSEITQAFREDPQFSPVLLRQSFDFVYRSHVQDLGVIASDALVPVVAFYGQLDRVAKVIEDLRSDSLLRVPSERRLEIYRDYVEMLETALDDAVTARDALSRFIGDS